MSPIFIIPAEAQTAHRRDAEPQRRTQIDLFTTEARRHGEKQKSKSKPEATEVAEHAEMAACGRPFAAASAEREPGLGKRWSLFAPVHPGEMLREEFMKPMGISINSLALELHVPVTRISGKSDGARLQRSVRTQFPSSTSATAA